MSELARRRRWTRRLADARVHGAWEQIAGEAVARHAEPVRLAGGVLVVRATSPGWATQLRYLSGELVERANAVLGSGAVTQVRVVSDGTERDRKKGV